MQTVCGRPQLLVRVSEVAHQGALCSLPAFGSVRSLQGRSFQALKLQSSAAKPSRAATLSPMALFGSAAASTEGVYQYTVKDIDNKNVDLSKYQGKVVLVCNVASQCGFTPQYKELAALYDKFPKDLVILGFPCNQFGAQEPGSNAEIKAFAKKQGANFPMMAKVDVNGSNADPFFNYLKSQQGGLLTSDIKWNFTKFLIDRNGKVVKRYGSPTTPLSIEADVKALL